jgi:hypothetical protein
VPRSACVVRDADVERRHNDRFFALMDRAM